MDSAEESDADSVADVEVCVVLVVDGGDDPMVCADSAEVADELAESAEADDTDKLRAPLLPFTPLIFDS